MASAVDIDQSTASPSASPPKTPVQSPPTNIRMNAVACEVPVIATGARPSEKGGRRELFTEDTSTVLVFQNGAVLRLSAQVDPGQLLFLTHKETKLEVVAQVTRKRDFRPGICYVEIEFSEPSPEFWGVKFPATPALDRVNPQQEKATQSAQAVEDIIADQPGPPMAAPSDQEITALKIEVEMLRQQLKLLQTKPVTENSSAADVPPALSQPVSAEHPEAPFKAGAFGEPFAKLQPQITEAPKHSPADLSGGLEKPHDAPPASSSLTVGVSKPPFSAQDLLPKPTLDAEDATPPAKSASAPDQMAAVGRRRAAMRKDLLFAAFVLIVACAAWYQNLLPSLPRLKNLFSSATPSVAPRLAPRTPQKAATIPADSAKSPQPSEALATTPVALLPNGSQPAPIETGKPSTLPANDSPDGAKTGSGAAADAMAAAERPKVATPSRKHPVPLSSKAEPVFETPHSAGAETSAPKLIKSVRAVARPDALQDFSTGNANSVTFDALVDTSGHVKSMKALSGSAPLQKAAMEALKQYVYEPATHLGKPVPAHVKVIIKFLFEP